MADVFRRYRCQYCSHVFDEAEGDPESGLAPGTRWEDVPDDWICTECGSEKRDYTLIDWE